ncbi:hypothetical protein B5V00_00630 [Geothermobacter hydrogeniphilus]|uniref:Uncharacterized protein n=1 Tax=Geothermobacter hydrogeniphilus TaxID=1969733 RepID=A0A1X0YEJ6_9BACT|nr:hypothetical protein B5V00_00630 [Geothermobacter hydrogeniphilus]
MVRVCHVISGDLWAGAEVMACHLLRHLQNEPGIALRVVLLNRGRLADELRSAGITVDVVEENNLSFRQLVCSIHALLKAAPPHILHSHRYKENLVVFLVSRRLSGVRLVASQHGLPETPGGHSGWRHRIKSRINFFVMARFFHRVVPVSRDIMTLFVSDLGFCAERISVIPNGVELPVLPDRAEDVDVVTLGSSGRLFPVKDYPLMVRVVKEIGAAEKVRALLAGEGPERSRIERGIAENDLEGAFRLVGHLDAMDDFYRGLDIYLNTSVHEGIPMTILEAMAHGLPVIAPAVGGIPEIIEDGVEGFLVAERSPKKYAEKCLLLIRDSRLRRRMGAAARQRVETCFSAAAMAAEYATLYRRMNSTAETAIVGDVSDRSAV